MSGEVSTMASSLARYSWLFHPGTNFTFLAATLSVTLSPTSSAKPVFCQFDKVRDKVHPGILGDVRDWRT